MKWKIIKAENPKIDIKEPIEYDFKDVKVGDKIRFFGVDMNVIQMGEYVTLVGKDKKNNSVMYVLERVYEEEPYITDYKQIKEPEHLLVNENEKIFVVKHPMSLEALYKYIRYHAPTKEPSINMIGNDYFEFVNGWRLYGSESHKNIKAGKYSYESKPIKV